MPILLYCAEIWYPNIPKDDAKKIESFYLNHLKRILGVPMSTANSAVYFELGQFSVETMVKCNLLKFLVRLKKHTTNWNSFLRKAKPIH